jgi:hypothetical protein
MKKILFALLICTATLSLTAQDTLQLADNGKYAYADIADIAIQKQDTERRVLDFMKRGGLKDISILPAGSSFSAGGVFMMRKRSIASGTPDARIGYTIRIDFKANKYRCLISDFVVSPVTRDRFGNHRVVDGIAIPLEKKPGKLNEKIWEDQKAELLDQCRSLAAQLKLALSAQTETAQQVKKITTSSEW